MSSSSSRRKKRSFSYLDLHHDHHLGGHLIVPKSERKPLVEVVPVLGTDSSSLILSITQSLIVDHHHIEDIDIIKTNVITVVVLRTIIERKTNDIVLVRLQVKTSTFLLVDQILLFQCLLILVILQLITNT